MSLFEIEFVANDDTGALTERLSNSNKNFKSFIVNLFNLFEAALKIYIKIYFMNIFFF